MADGTPFEAEELADKYDFETLAEKFEASEASLVDDSTDPAESTPAPRTGADDNAELSTNELNRVLRQAVDSHPPPYRSGFRPKLRYAHQGGKRPPNVVIHGTRTGSLPDHYLRYLERQFRGAFGMEGVPLRLSFRSQESPYKGRARHKNPPKRVARKKAKKGKK